MKVLRPIAASEWVTFLPSFQELLQHNGGALPVNDIFLPLWEKSPDMWILFGGRGGGKSEAICDRLIAECRKDCYFKCYYGRKVFDTIRGSCFETLISCIRKSGLEGEFHFSEAGTSSMVIVHQKTGNKFVPFGSDKPQKLKSIRNPTHIWCEEFPEFTFEDFKELLPTLRTSGAANQLIASLNAYSIFTDNWIVKLFFPDLYTGEDKAAEDILDGLNVGKIFANYTDNHFIDQADYKRRLWLSAAGNQVIFEGLANGDFGVVENNNPWLYAFDNKKHVKPTLPFLPSFPVYLSFDFNNDPFACTAWQFSPPKGSNNSFIHCIKEFSGKIKVEEMCQQIKTTFPASILYITGDRSGKNEDVGRNQTLYQLICSFLGVHEKLLDTNDTNLEHADSRLLMNAMFANYPNIYLSQEGCPNFIRQCQIAKTDEESKKPSQLLKDRGLYKMDEFDSGRYIFQTYFLKYAREKYFKAINKKVRTI